MNNEIRTDGTTTFTTGVGAGTIDERNVSQRGENNRNDENGQFENANIAGSKSNQEDQFQIEEQQKRALIEEYIESAAQERILALNGYEVRDRFPKSWKALEEYCQRRSQAPAEIDEDVLLSLLLYSPRLALYDYFDDLKVFINVVGCNEQWNFTITSGQDITTDRTSYRSRIGAEKLAFDDAFKTLENKL